MTLIGVLGCLGAARTVRAQVYNPLWFPLVEELLGGGAAEGEAGVTLLYSCIMVAEAAQSHGSRGDGGSISSSTNSAQRWHADGGHVFDHAHLPPHCINVFVPLVDLSANNGPTEFVPGTHVLGHFNATTATHTRGPGEHAPAVPVLAPAPAAGGVVMFDYRCKHRGGVNHSGQDRLLLCLCYCKPWFQDLGNPRSRIRLMEGGRVEAGASSAARPMVRRPLRPFWRPF
jgi:hypothetical protein